LPHNGQEVSHFWHRIRPYAATVNPNWDWQVLSKDLGSIMAGAFEYSQLITLPAEAFFKLPRKRA